MTQVLWLSRHEMSAEQRADLEGLLGPTTLTQVNMTYAEDSGTAAQDVLREALGYAVLAGVFPAHVAVRLARAKPPTLRLALPVSRAKPAAEGQIRGFEHARWELF